MAYASPPLPALPKSVAMSDPPLPAVTRSDALSWMFRVTVLLAVVPWLLMGSVPM